MGFLQWLGMIGLAMVAVWAVIRHSQLIRPSGAAWRRGERAGSVVKDRFRDRYVSETVPAYFQYVRRRYRYAVQCPVQYHSNEHSGQGMVADMTRDGWRIQGQSPMIPGTVLSVNLMLPGVTGGLPIARAVVCWARGTEFGLKLEAMDSRAAAQLREYCSSIPQVMATASKAA